MPRDPNIPDAFDVYAMVLLRRPGDAPQMTQQELNALCRAISTRPGD
jgi:hypothetical protein